MRQIVRDSSLVHLVGLLFVARLAASSGYRLIYPLAPFFESEFEMERSQIGGILALSEISAVPALFLASMGDKWSVKKLLFGACALMSLSYALISFESGNMVIMLLFSRILFVVAYQILFTNILAVLFGAVPKDAQIQVTSFIELTWGLSALLSVPLISLAFRITSYYVIFLLIASIHFIIGLDVLYKVPADHLQFRNEEMQSKPSLRQIFEVLNHVSVITYNLSAVFFMLAYNGIFTILAFLLKDEHDIDSSEIGLSFFIIGLSELTGVMLLSFLGSRIMVERLYTTAYIATCAIVVSLVSLGFATSYGSLLFHLAAFFFLSEFVGVFTIAETPVYVPAKYRSSVISFHAVCMFVGRSLGAILGERAYNSAGLVIALIIFGAAMIISIVLLRIGELTKRDFETLPEEKDRDSNEEEIRGEPDQGGENIVLS